MKALICAVYDNVLKTYGRTFQAQSEDDARRSFTIGVNDENSVLSQAPQDFELYALAIFEVDTGEIVPAKDKLMTGLDGSKPTETESGE